MQLKTAQTIISRLKLEYISIPLAHTNQGWLYLKYTKGNNEPQIILDAVPVEDADLLSYLKEKFIDEK